MPQQPLVSIVVPTYDRLGYLKEALDSAVCQNYRNIEIIVCDDCSPQSPEPLIRSYRDDRIHFHRNASRQGVYQNVICAFGKAEGEYVATLHDDDVWEPTFLQELLPPLLRDHELALSFCDHYVMDSSGRIDWPMTERNTHRWGRDRLLERVYKPFHALGVVYQSVSPAAATVVRRSLLPYHAIPERAGVCWDLYAAYLACSSGRGAYYVPKRLTRYRVHNQSETLAGGRDQPEAKVRWARARMFCHETFLSDPALRQFRWHFRRKWAESATSAAVCLLQTNEQTLARQYSLQSLLRRPSLRALAALALSLAPACVSRQVLSMYRR